MSAARPPGTVRLMTWNIHGGIGPDRVFDLDRIAALIDRHAPDILALQEIDTRGRGIECLAPLRELAISHLTEARTITAPDGHYGHALFSRWPVSNVELHDLSIRRREPRVAIEGVLHTPLGALHLVAVHLGLAILERRRQARMLARLARRVAKVRAKSEPEAASCAVPTVMLGDFNDWFSFGEVSRTLWRVLPERTRLRTFPACRPLLRLDRIYCSVPGMIVSSFTDMRAQAASDHLPIIADIRLARAGERRPELHPEGHVDLAEPDALQGARA